jgi:hypothetical protein
MLENIYAYTLSFISGIKGLQQDFYELPIRTPLRRRLISAR